MNFLPLPQSNQSAGWFKGARAKSEFLVIAAAALSAGLLLCGWGQAQHPLTTTGMPEPGRFSEYKAKAEKGDPEAQTLLGLCYHQGQGTKQDDKEAVKWISKAARQGLAPAQFNLGVSYFNGCGVVKDQAQAVMWYRKAAKQGCIPAQYNLGVSYFSGLGVEKDAVEAVKWIRKAAEKGLAVAQYNLGTCFLNGQGVGQDQVAAVRWFRRAADQGYADAQHDLGNCFLNGLGVESDVTEAVKWFRKAAEQGSAPSQYNLGISYRDGLGVKKDTAEAVKWFCKAAEQGEPHAQCRVGFIYCIGWGVPKDAERGCMYFNLAAASMNRFPEAEEAREALQSMEMEMPPAQIVGARAKAAEWALDAANRGNPDAHYALSMMYFNEHCLPKDLVRAHLYISLAALSNQIPEAVSVRDAIEKKMTSDQIAEARRLAQDWKPTQ